RASIRTPRPATPRWRPPSCQRFARSGPKTRNRSVERPKSYGSGSESSGTGASWPPCRLRRSPSRPKRSPPSAGSSGRRSPRSGRLLAVLAAGRTRLAESGTGTGYGAAWLASGMAADAGLVTVEPNPDLAAAAAELFADDPRVTVVHGDARDVLPPLAPFDLLFLDGGPWKQEPEERLLELIA